MNKNKYLICIKSILSFKNKNILKQIDQEIDS